MLYHIRAQLTSSSHNDFYFRFLNTNHTEKNIPEYSPLRPAHGRQPREMRVYEMHAHREFTLNMPSVRMDNVFTENY